MIRAGLLPHTVTITTPDSSGTDRYNQPVITFDVPPATTRTVKAFIQPASQLEEFNDRDASITDWFMITNDTALDHLEQVTWDGKVFEIIGDPAVYSTPRGEHHRTARLQRVVG